MSEEKALEIDIPKLLSNLSSIALKLSVKYVEDLVNGVATKEDLQYVNEVKRHLAFCKKLDKEMNPEEKQKAQGFAYPEDVVKKIKSMGNTIGDIVRTMKK